MKTRDLYRHVLWTKAQDFAQSCAVLIVRLPRDRSVDPLASQLMRASASIAANIAEGYGRYSQAAYGNHLSIARGSAFESESWIDLLARLNHQNQVDEKTLLLRSCDELQRLITLRMKSLNDSKTYAVRDGSEEYDANA